MKVFGEKEGKTAVAPLTATRIEPTIETTSFVPVERIARNPAGQLAAAELLEARVIEIRQEAERIVADDLVTNYAKTVEQFKERWRQIDPVDRITQLISGMNAWNDRVKTAKDESLVMFSDAMNMGQKTLKQLVESADNMSKEAEKLLLQIGGFKTCPAIIKEGLTQELMQHESDAATTLRSAEAAVDAFKATINRRYPVQFPVVDALIELQALLKDVTALSDQAQKMMPPKDLAQIPEKFRRGLSTSQQRLADSNEKSYRSSVEARYLRLIREIQEMSEQPAQERSTARKLATQLASTKDLDSVISEVSTRLISTTTDHELAKSMILAARQQTGKKHTQPSPDKSDEAATRPNSSDSSDPSPKVDLGFVALYLGQFGIVDREFIEKIAPRLTVESIEKFEQDMQSIEKSVLELLMAKNPALIDPDYEVTPKTFAKQFALVLKTAAGLEGFEIFDPAKFPEHFCSIKALEKTLAAAQLIHKVKNQVTVDYYHELEAAAATAGEALPQPVQNLHPEQHLIDRLASLVTYPNLAYGLLREGFFYKGAYHNCTVPKGFRDKLLKSVFETEPRPKDMRTTERELIRLGLLVITNANHTGATNTLALATPKELTDPILRDLLLALMNMQTRPTNAPKLAPK